MSRSTWETTHQSTHLEYLSLVTYKTARRLCGAGVAQSVQSPAYGMDDLGLIPCRAGIYLFATASKPAVLLTHPPIQWAPGAVYVGIERPGRETDVLPPYSAEIKTACSYTATLRIRLHGVVLS